MNFFKLMAATIIMLLLSFNVIYANSIKYTGRSVIIKNDIKIASKQSLDNALIGAVKEYVAKNSRGNKVSITGDHLAFIEEYEILDRKIVGNSIETTVNVKLNELILDDIAIYISESSDTAVFLITGLPRYANKTKVDKFINDIFNSKKIKINGQNNFIRELNNSNSISDIKNAFRSVPAKYLFIFDLSIPSYIAGQTCTVDFTASYIDSAKINSQIPILKRNIVIESSLPEECINIAVENLISEAIDITKTNFITPSTNNLQLQEYYIVFEGDMDLKKVNSIVDNLLKTRVLKTAEMSEIFDSSIVFVVTSFLSPIGLNDRIANMYDISYINIDNDDTIIIRF